MSSANKHEFTYKIDDIIIKLKEKEIRDLLAIYIF